MLTSWLPPSSSSISTARWSTPRPTWSRHSTSSWRAKACRRCDYETARNMVGGGARADDRARACGRGPQPAAADARRLRARFHRALRRAYRRSFAAFSRLEAALDALASAAAGSPSAPTSSNGCRVSCSTRSACRSASPRSAAPTRSACTSPIRRYCAGRSRGPAAEPDGAVMVGDSITDIATAAGRGHPGDRRRFRLH